MLLTILMFLLIISVGLGSGCSLLYLVVGCEFFMIFCILLLVYLSGFSFFFLFLVFCGLITVCVIMVWFISFLKEEGVEHMVV